MGGSGKGDAIMATGNKKGDPHFPQNKKNIAMPQRMAPAFKNMQDQEWQQKFPVQQ